jgi:isopenicillin N synthase-like dioxygenase|tara:strand:- start:353 stop:1216 length:864 start_codon:yes stop_codon:yes gene_type:complete
MHKIPTISYTDLKNTNNDVLDFLTSSLENNGFFVINDHPINLDLIKRTFDIAEEMFNLPYEIKQKYHVPGTNGARGYTPYGIETALNEKVADQKEFWHQGSTTNSALMSNIYIEEVNNFSDLDVLYKEFESMGVEILKAFTNFKLDYNSDISDAAQNGNSILRLIHYPPTDGTNAHRARAHNDVNLITLLIGGNEAGLEAQDKKGNWVECNCDENEIICNIGDMLEIISNEKLNSTPHRVVSKGNEEKSRYSIPFFLHPRPEVMLDAEKTLTADQFLTKRLQDIKLN